MQAVPHWPRAIVTSNARATVASKSESPVALGRLGEGPATECAEVVDRGHSAGAPRDLLLARVLAPIALDFDDDVEQVAIATEDATTADKRKEPAGAPGMAHIGRPMTNSQGPFIETPSGGTEVSKGKEVTIHAQVGHRKRNPGSRPAAREELDALSRSHAVFCEKLVRRPGGFRATSPTTRPTVSTSHRTKLSCAITLGR